LGKGSWNTEKHIILHIMPLAIMQILFPFEGRIRLCTFKKSYPADLVKKSRIGS
jgi:hypothetical protein